MNQKLLIFLPRSDIFPYVRTLCSIADSLSDDVYFIKSSKYSIYNRIINDYEITDSQEKLINMKNYFDIAENHYSFKSIDIDNIITENKVKELQNLIPYDIKSLCSFTYKNFEIGKIAEYDLVLDTKFLSINNLNIFQIKKFRRYILKALISAELTEYLCFTLKPERIITFNPYTMNQVCCFFAKKNGVDFEYFTNKSFRGADYSKFLCSKRLFTMDIFRDVKKFTEFNNYHIQKKYVEYSWQDAFFRFYGSDGHIFSNSKSDTPEEILEKLNLSKSKKTIIAFTSSNDEIIGIKLTYEVWKEPYPLKNVFENQIDWIKFLKDYADSHKDIQIIVRVHPREGNRQNGKPSEHLLLLQKTFTERTDNFVIVWADDPISSYDLLELADLCLVNWSTMGQECARVGIPVLTYTSGSYYVDSKSFTVAKTKKEYEEKLSSIINEEYTLDILTDAIRYNFWRNHINAIDCSDTIPHDFNDESVWPRISEEKAAVIKDICSGKTTALEYNKKIWLDSINENTSNEEKDAVLEGISEFYNRVFTTKKTVAYEKVRYFIFRCLRKVIKIITLKKISIQYKPRVHSNINSNKMIYIQKNAKFKSFITRKPYYLLEKDNEILYFYKGKKYRRYSPLLYKLGLLYKENKEK